MENYLYCYKMTHDTESAPNPHHGVLTLAICKPTIRRCALVGDWISGWTANMVHGKDKKHHSFDKPKLIYLARITQKMTFAEYWEKYPQKQPQIIGYNQAASERKTCGGSYRVSDTIYDSGDNIYKPNKRGGFTQVKNNNHTKKEKKHDLSGVYVLICEEFYYYGVNNAKEVGKNVFDVTVPRCKKLPLDDQCMMLIDHIKNDDNVQIKG